MFTVSTGGDLDSSQCLLVTAAYGALCSYLDAKDSHRADFRTHVLGELYLHVCGRRAAAGKELSPGFAQQVFEEYLTTRMRANVSEIGTGHHRRRCYTNVSLKAL